MAAIGANYDFREVVNRAAERYRAIGRHAYYFCRSKLAHDPVFHALLDGGHIPDGARVVDLGCGQGVLAALLASANGLAVLDRANDAPHYALHGIDLRSGAIAEAKRALADLGDRVRFEVGDLRTVEVPPADVIIILDVLHYLDDDAQRRLLQRSYRALTSGGTLLLRVGDAEGGWRFRLTLAIDKLVGFVRHRGSHRLTCRSLAQWMALVQASGFDVEAHPMSRGTPFCNALLVARRR